MQPDLTLSLSGRIASIRDGLIEARRYVAVNPELADSAIRLEIGRISSNADLWCGKRWKHFRYIVETLLIGKNALISNPDVCIAALTVVIHCMGALRSGLEKEAAAPARDRELAEAYGAPQ